MKDDLVARYSRGMETAAKLAKARGLVLVGFKRHPDGEVEGICISPPLAGEPPEPTIPEARPKKVRRSFVQPGLL